eukprot:CAMPEP_0197393288 /NCGR_PEP_ID=MMETSP1165-20131217/4233_1 /TAXON_ID=284809 /ORGANISM="Chrysocystis fragilis, Strain CCMP3189" /LENGTH=30 /DNA_ID= /DNA_START= /DNA_END= /DNA_ORIENTATION=
MTHYEHRSPLLGASSLESGDLDAHLMSIVL